MSDAGVIQITTGTIICGNIGNSLRQLVKQADPPGYETYRTLKYPNGEDSVTEETARAAMAFIFDRAAELLLPHYVSSAAVKA